MVKRDSGEGLRRELGFGQASSVVVGIVIGSGIFVGANRVAAGVDHVGLIFAVWVGAGLLTLLGALTYAEFGAAFPRSGGDYVYARRAFGPFWGFFNGWLTFSINYPASLAALALAWAGQLDLLKPGAHRVLFFDDFSLKFTAIAVLAIFVVVNYLGVKQGGRTQFALTATKVALILGLVVLGLTAAEAQPDNLARSATTSGSLAVALVGALWAFDGWTGVTRVAGEVRDPQRNVPRALITGILGVMVIYLLLTLTYVLVLGHEGVAGTGLADAEARAVASRVAAAVAGDVGQTFITVLILVSILGPINGLTLAGPRTYYAMARDRLFPPLLGRVHPRRHVPHASIMFQGVLSAALVLFFSFEQLSSYVILASWTAYAITGIGLMRLRRREPERRRPYRVPGYPLVPLLFILLSTSFVAYLIVDPFWTADQYFLGLPVPFLYLLGNVFVMALSVPAYHFFKWWARRASPMD